MAGEGFRADADALAARAGQFDALAQRAGAIHRDLDDVLSAVGECWGGDEVGRSFASGYLGAARDTLGDLGALPDRLGDVGGRFLGTAEGYRGGDADNARTIGSADA
ncbi:WXG100 family type VII secretion target [Actinokineospora spheciospongiae]|uniref:WXG100 family type VII secretion target n=1 Tax=Actinokineospora spheciospongiae TaxID=909613 RepID=UPI000D713B09|nr:hypothetical protein [Actinokineospora spheciospongiae]PWW64533.1 hypothetical protein DFQ13_103507 [Actinokineospora spheciospongiae]